MNRRWLVRVVGYLADEVGINQFLDLGSGLPTTENTHQVAQRHNPEVQVVYVDIDPICSAHGRAMLEENDFTTFVEADMTRTADLLKHPDVVRRIDLDQPVALMQCGTLHHVPDESDPAGMMREYIDALPSGSYIAMTHFWASGGGGCRAEQEGAGTRARLHQARPGQRLLPHPRANRLAVR